jgi:hypothetical protein
MEWSRGMPKRRVATTVLLFALFGAACGGSDKPVQVLGEQFTRSSAPPTTGTTVLSSSSSTSATSATSDPAQTVPSQPAPPSVPETTIPAPGSITVNYAPHDGGRATATLEESGDTKAIDAGSALFSDLDEGTYTVHITIEQPGTDPSTGTATYINRSRPIALHSGDNAVVNCDDTGCSTGVL